jgi:hypothetical protein
VKLSVEGGITGGSFGNGNQARRSTKKGMDKTGAGSISHSEHGILEV